MKKMNFLAMGLAVAAALASCSQEQISAPSNDEGTKMTIKVTSAETRNLNDGLKTLWIPGDQITVWHAAAGTSEYVKDGQFAATNADTTASTSFTGTYQGTLEASSAYDWYVVYPWKEQCVSPAGDTTGFIGVNEIGRRAPEQAAFNSSAHISGSQYPMFGKASAVVGDAVPSVTMAHLSNLVKVVVKNSTGASIRPHSVIFTAPQGTSISGNYAMNLTVDPVVLTPKPNETYNYVWLNVKGGAELDNGASADFYFSVKPFSLKAGETLKLNVNGYEKSIVLSESTSFEAGKMKVLNFDYNDTKDYSGTYVLGSEVNGHFYMCEGRSYTNKEVDPSTNGNVKLAYGKAARLEGKTIYYTEDISISTIDSDATIDDYKLTVTKVTEGDYTGMYTIQNKAGLYMSSSVAGKNNCVFESTATVDSYWDIAITDNKALCCVTKSSNNRSLKFNYNNGTFPRFIISPYSNTSADVQLLNLNEYTLAADPVPTISVEDIQGVDAAGVTDKTTEVVFGNNTINAWTASIDSFTGCVSAASILGTTVTYSVSANTDTTVKTGTIVVKLSKDSQNVTATINISQNGKAASGSFERYYVKVTADKADWTGEHYLLVCEQGAKAYIMYTDANYTDGINNKPISGHPAFEVTLYSDGIGYDETAMAGEISIRKQSQDSTDTGAIVEGAYTFFLPVIPGTENVLRQSPAGFGCYGRNPNNTFCGNYNTAHQRFQEWIAIDNGNLHLYSVTNGNGNAYFRFDLTTKTFGWTKAASTEAPWGVGTIALKNVTIDAADVQLYQLQDK